MCDSPVQIKNPNFSPAFEHAYKYGPNARLNISRYSAVKYPLDSYIYVPCGHCRSCLQASQSYMIQRFKEHCKGKWVIFCTATYRNEMLPRLEGVTKDGEEYSIPYADTRDFRLMIKRIRKDNLFCREFTYWCTTEYGNGDKHGGRGTNHRPHFHYFIFVDKLEGEDENDGLALAEKWEQCFLSQWKRNISKSTKFPVYEPLSRFIKMPDGTGTYDVHLLRELPGHDDNDPIFYASAYCYAYDEYVKKTLQYFYCNLEYEDYIEFRKKFRPRRVMSLRFGISADTDEYITDCINFCLKNNIQFPCYFDDKGNSSPLSRYYKDKYMTMKQYIRFAAMNPDGVIKDSESGEIICNTRATPVFDKQKMLDLRRLSLKFQRICLKLQREHLTFEFDDD